MSKNDVRQIQVYISGLALPVDLGGLMCHAFTVVNGGQTIYFDQASGFPCGTSKISTYTCMKRALDWLRASPYKDGDILIKADSAIVINQITGKAKVEHSIIIALHQAVTSLINQFKHLRLELISPGQNSEANTLSKKAYESLADKYPNVGKSEMFLQFDETTMEEDYDFFF